MTSKILEGSLFFREQSFSFTVKHVARMHASQVGVGL